MDCKYIADNEIHEQYLMNRLTPDEKNEYLGHIDSCRDCAADLYILKKSISLIRADGKRRMKSEIIEQAEQLRSKQDSMVALPMFLKVAAVIFFLVLTPVIIYHYNQMPVENPLTYGPEEMKDMAVTEEAEVPDKTVAEEDIAEGMMEQEADISERTVTRSAARKSAAARGSREMKSLTQAEGQDRAKSKAEENDLGDLLGVAGAGVEDIVSKKSDGATGEVPVAEEEKKEGLYLADKQEPVVEAREESAKNLKMRAAAQQPAAPMAMESVQTQGVKTLELKYAGKTIILNFYISDQLESDESLYLLKVEAVQDDSAMIVISSSVNETLYKINTGDLSIEHLASDSMTMDIKGQFRMILYLKDQAKTIEANKIPPRE